MKYLVIKSFKGSPDGRFAVEYNAGETVELTDSLARVALGEEWVRAVASSSGSADAGGEDAAPAQAAAPTLVAKTLRQLKRLSGKEA